MNNRYEMVQEACRAVRARTKLVPRCGIILGTGLGRLADSITSSTVIPYSDIPHFPLSTVETHAGELIIGRLAGKIVVAMKGRFHFYEGYSMSQIALPVWVMKTLGVRTLIVSNAAGGLNPLFPPGTLVAITDHINLLGSNPLIGQNDERLGPRFPDMSEPYSRELLELAMKVAQAEGIRLERGVYAAMTGPCLETRAEYRMLRILGADLVGMSTVPEVIAAVHSGMRVLGISVVTDACLPDALEPADIRKIIATANRAEPSLVRLITRIVARL